MGGGQPSSGGTTITKTEPWDTAKPYYEELYKQGKAAYDKIDKTPYSGQLVAGTDPLVTDARNRALSLMPVLSESASGIGDLATRNLRGDFLRAESNPYLQDTMRASNDASIRQFQESVAPSIDSAAISSGAYGGARNGLAYGRASQGLADELSNTNAKIAYQNYATERENQQAAPTMLNQAIQLGLQPAQIQEQIGGARQQEQQDILDSELARYNANLMSPFRGIDTWANVLGNGGFKTGTEIGSSASRGSGGFRGALSGGLGGAALGAGAASAFPAALAGLGMTGIGAPLAIGAGLGALMGGLF